MGRDTEKLQRVNAKGHRGYKVKQAESNVISNGCWREKKTRLLKYERNKRNKTDAKRE